MALRPDMALGPDMDLGPAILVSNCVGSTNLFIFEASTWNHNLSCHLQPNHWPQTPVRNLSVDSPESSKGNLLISLTFASLVQRHLLCFISQIVCGLSRGDILSPVPLLSQLVLSVTLLLSQAWLMGYWAGTDGRPVKDCPCHALTQTHSAQGNDRC